MPSSSNGSIIAGTRISINVHYDKDDVTTHLDSSESPPPPSPAKSDEADSNITSQSSTDGNESIRSKSTASPRPIAMGEERSVSAAQELQAVNRLEEVISEARQQEEWVHGPDQVIPSGRLHVSTYDGAVRLKIGERGLSAKEPVSVPGVLQRTVNRFGDRPALLVKRKDQWITWTYRQYQRDVYTCAKAFIALGLQRNRTVCILGFNSPEWFISGLAAIHAGGISAGIYTTNSAEACHYCITDSVANIVVVEDQKQLAKILQFRDQMPNVKAIVQYAGKPEADGVISWSELMDLGSRQPDSLLDERLKRIAVNQCATLIYTSGTTGPPKGVMVSHDNLTWTAEAGRYFVKFDEGMDRCVSFLPLSHIAAQMLDIQLPILTAAAVYFAQPDALKGSLVKTLAEVHPTFFLSVPRVYEKMHETMMERLKDVKGLKKSLFSWAQQLSLKYWDSVIAGNPQKPFGFGLANALVFKKIHVALGLDCAKAVYSAAAPFNVETCRFLRSLNLPITELYGMSESTGPHTIDMQDTMRPGSVGITMPGAYTKIVDPDKEGNGEICMGGRHVFMGYLNKEEKTAETVDEEGWLHSGDIGRLDAQGYMHITGRLKELIITAGGENIPPVLIEDDLKKELPCISNAMLIGDRKKYLSVLLTFKVVVNTDTMEPTDELTALCRDWCLSVGSSCTTVGDILSGPEPRVMAAIQAGIDRVNSRATSNAQKVQKWTVLPVDFCIAGGELGPTLKLKRPFVVKKYATTIDALYGVST